MAKLTKTKAKEMLKNPPRGKKLTDKQRKYFGAVANAQRGIETLDPNSLTASINNTPNNIPKPKSTGKRARIIANAMFPEFREEYERARGQYAKHFPGGVEFVEASGYEDLKKAFGQVTPEEDLIMMAHHNPFKMYGVDVANPSFGGKPSPQEGTLAGLFSGLEKRGYKGNCYLGICEGEETARSLQGAGVDIPIFSTPEDKKWFGVNPAAKGDFEDFFFGVGKRKDLKPSDLTTDTNWGTVTETIDPEIGKDYLMNISPRQQELMKRRREGEPVRQVTPLKGGGSIPRGYHVMPDGTIMSDLDMPNYRQGGGLKRSEDYGSKKKPYPSVKSSDFAGGKRSYPIPTKADAIDALRLAGLHGRSDVKSKVYKKYPELKKSKYGDKLSYQEGGFLGKLDTKLEDIGGIGGATTGLVQGIQMLEQERQNRKQAEKFAALSKVVGEAASLRSDMPSRKYVRPEDMVVDPTQLHPVYGTGTNYLAKQGGKYPAKYQAGGFFPGQQNQGNVGNAGSALGSLLGGGGGQQTGAGQIGSTIGGVAGTFFGPLGTMAGSAIGGLIGGAIGGGAEREKQRKQQEALSTLQNAAFQQGTSNLQDQYSGFMNYGGKIPYMQGGGELEIYDGDAEIISSNPYLPAGGETIQFNGPSHEEGGIPIQYGNTPVEVEGGEPAVKLEHGGGGNNLIVYGDMKIPSYGATELNDPKAKGKKFKTYIKELSKTEERQQEIMDKGLDILNTTEAVDSFDKLKMSSGKAMLEGSNMKMKDIAKKKQIAAAVQNAILDTADEFGLKSDELAKGSIKKAKKGAKIRGYAQNGDDLIPVGKAFRGNNEFSYPSTLGAIEALGRSTEESPVPASGAMAGAPPSAPPPTPEEKQKVDWMSVVNSVLPYVRPSNQLPLDPTQLSGEMFALATNQLEPVQAQTYQPLLESVSNVSMQDQLNLNQADFNALKRLTANNPAAQATLAAQKYSANQSVLGEQFRMNQAQRMATYGRNRAALNDATLKNLAILDQQYTRQAGAKSATKAIAQNALSSIADKIAKNKLENRTLGIYENLYNYRFGPRGQAFNLNPLFQANIPDVGSSTQQQSGNVTTTERLQTMHDELGRMLGSKKTEQTVRKSEDKRNGGIVKAIKNL